MAEGIKGEVVLLHVLFFHGGVLQKTSGRALAGFQSEVHVAKQAVKSTSMVMIYSQSSIFIDLRKKKKKTKQKNTNTEDYEPRMSKLSIM